MIQRVGIPVDGADRHFQLGGQLLGPSSGRGPATAR